jgi:hypothetical protein
MKLVIAEDNDRQQWDDIVDCSPNGSIFYTWKWVKLLEKHSTMRIAGVTYKSRFYPMFIVENEKKMGIYPLYFFKTPLGPFCYSPPSNTDLLYLGPLIPNLETMKQEKKQIFLHNLQVQVDRFIKKEIKANYIQINTPPGFDDCRYFIWGGYNATPRYTYYVDLISGTDKIFKNFNRSLRYYIEKSKKEGITISEGNKEDAFFIRDLLEKRDRIPSTKEYTSDVFDEFYPDHVKVFVAKAGSERLSGIITIIYKDMVTFWIGAPKCSYKGLSPNDLLLWEGIRWSADQGYKIFQIEGADDYSLFPFKRKFNGKIALYYQVKWLSPTHNLISSVYNAVRPKNKTLLDGEWISK